VLALGLRRLFSDCALLCPVEALSTPVVRLPNGKACERGVLLCGWWAVSPSWCFCLSRAYVFCVLALEARSRSPDVMPISLPQMPHATCTHASSRKMKLLLPDAPRPDFELLRHGKRAEATATRAAVRPPVMGARVNALHET